MQLLHISDIHFRRGVADSTMDRDQQLRDAILDDVATLRFQHGSVDMVLLSGDTAFGGHPDEYALANSWLGLLCDACGCERANVFVCPGNHDVVRDVTRESIVEGLHQLIKSSPNNTVLDDRLRKYLSEPGSREALYKSLNNYNTFAARFECIMIPPRQTIVRRSLQMNDGSTLELVALNSAFVSSEHDALGQLFVDPSYINLRRVPGVEYVVLCHHPFPWLRHGDLLEDFLNNVARIQLFGHEHRQRVYQSSRWIRLAAGALHPDRHEATWQPGYNWLQLTVHGSGSMRELEVVAHVRAWQDSPPRFIARTDEDGNREYSQRIQLGPWERPVAESAVSQSTCEPTRCIETTTSDQTENDQAINIRDVALAFFELTLSQQSEIAGRLNLLEEGDRDLLDFARFSLAIQRAGERGQLGVLAQEIRDVQSRG